MEPTISSASVCGLTDPAASSAPWGIVSKPTNQNGIVTSTAKSPGSTPPSTGCANNGARWALSPPVNPATMKIAVTLTKAAVSHTCKRAAERAPTQFTQVIAAVQATPSSRWLAYTVDPASVYNGHWSMDGTR